MSAKRAMAKGKKGTHTVRLQSLQRRARVLVEYAKCGNVSLACATAGVERQCHYDWLERDPKYKAAFAKAQELAADLLEEEAKRRAVNGVAKPIYQGGKLVGYQQEYSDLLLALLLKGNKRAVYSEQAALMLQGPDGGPATIQLVVMDAGAQDK